MAWLALLVVRALELYVLVGVLFALPFVLVGIGRVDPAAKPAGLGFRALVAPASAALWPLLLIRWIGGRHAPRERNAHRVSARSVEP